MKKLSEARRAALSRTIREARAARKWSQEEAAVQATAALRLAARCDGDDLPEEAELWASLEVTRHHVAGLESCPSAPLATATRRACLLALVLALGLDRALINRLSGAL